MTMFENKYMETKNVLNLNTYNAYYNYDDKSMSITKTTNPENDKSIFKNVDKVDNHTQRLKLPISYAPSFLETEITMSVEKDLNIVVTTVKNKNTDKVIRQIPEEEVVERLRYLKEYDKQLISLRERNASNIIAKDF
ncbi:MAG: hypothetical protein CV082_08835 [Candidatus Brocadia sp. BL1]|nr:MAG: hypothetical protein CV082_08835 [Candidatus Brocadia sp. BL1]